MSQIKIKSVPVPHRGHLAHFTHRSLMKRCRVPLQRAHLPFDHGASPVTVLPVDSTGNASVSCPMDDNDQYGICGPAAAAHMLGILSYGQGKRREWLADVPSLLKQYLKISGGDNGTDEDMMVGPQGVYTIGVAGDPKAVAVDHLDVDITNVALMQYLIDQFYGIQMAWSVPDAFINGFDTGTVWPKAMTPDPQNGHYTCQADLSGPATITGVNINGFSRLWTWGTWCWTSPAFLASVQPESFIVFSAMAYDPKTGLDSKGRHVSAQAAKWVACGGNAIKAAAVVALFPAVGPTPPPGPPGPPIPPVPPIPEPPVTNVPYAIVLSGQFPTGLTGHLTTVHMAGTATPASGADMGETPQTALTALTAIAAKQAADPMAAGPIVQAIIALIQKLVSEIPTLAPIVIADIAAGKGWLAILMDVLAAAHGHSPALA